MIKETNKATKRGQRSLGGGGEVANSAEALWGRRNQQAKEITFQAVGTEN